MALSLDSFAGATDDEKLTAAINFVRAQVHKPAIALDKNREYSFSLPRTIFSGLKIIGGAEFGNQPRSANSNAQRVRVSVTGGGPWLRMPASGSVFDFELSRLSLYGDATSDLIGGSAAVLWTSKIGDIGVVNFRHTLGSPSAKLLLTACHFYGWWNINNAQGRAITIGGSDCVLWEGSNCLIDSPPNLSTAVDCHVCFDYLSKSTIGQLYITAESGPAAIIINGSENSPGLVINSVRAEGRNAGAPSYGAVIRINGGVNTINDVWVAFAMSNPSAARLPGSLGVIDARGGNTIIDKAFYARANGVPESVPFLAASGASTKVAVRLARGVKDGTNVWTSKPVVRAINGAQVDADDSVLFTS